MFPLTRLRCLTLLTRARRRANTHLHFLDTRLRGEREWVIGAPASENLSARLPPYASLSPSREKSRAVLGCE